MDRTLRHICAALLVLAFALSTTQAVQASDMAVKHAAAASFDKSVPAGCNGCADADMGDVACVVVCAVPAAVMAVSDLQAVTVTRFEDEFGVGRAGPPDPFPPRRSLLV